MRQVGPSHALAEEEPELSESAEVQAQGQGAHGLLRWQPPVRVLHRVVRAAAAQASGARQNCGA